MATSSHQRIWPSEANRKFSYTSVKGAIGNVIDKLDATSPPYGCWLFAEGTEIAFPIVKCETFIRQNPE